MNKFKGLVFITLVSAITIVGTFIWSVFSEGNILKIQVLICAVSGIIGIVISGILQRRIAAQKLKSAQKLLQEKDNIKKESEEVNALKTKLAKENEYLDRINSLNALIEESESIEEISNQSLKLISEDLQLCQGLFYLVQNNDKLTALGSYAFDKSLDQLPSVEIGVGIIGQVAQMKKAFSLDSIPADFTQVVSGLGESKPNHLYVYPLIYKDELIGVFEVSTFENIDDEGKKLLETLSDKLAAGIHFRLEKKRLEETLSKIKNKQSLESKDDSGEKEVTE